MSDRRSRIDEAIDRAVRDLTQRDPRPGLRRRVLSAIEAPARRSVAFARLAVAAGALATLVFAMLLIRGGGTPKPPDQLAANPSSSAPAPAAAAAPPLAPALAPAPAPAPPLAPAPAPFAARRAGASIPQPGRVAAASLPLEEPTSPPVIAAGQMPDVEPLTAFPPITIVPLMTRPIEVPGIAIAPLQIAPLSPPR